MSDQPKEKYSFTKQFKSHSVFFIGMLAFIILDILIIIFNPIVPAWTIVEKTYTLFGLAIQASVLLFTIGFFLFYRWFSTGKNNSSTLLFAIAFSLFGILFVGLILQALGVSWADMKKPHIFFWWRNVMILWTALMYNGISRIITENKKWQIIPTIFILVVGYSIFIIGLFVFVNIDYMMLIFIYSILLPTSFLISYLFWQFGKQAALKSPKIIMLGFFLFLIAYAAWAPTHTTYNYWVFFAIFDLSLMVILIGFIILPYEVKINELSQKEE